MLAHIKEILEAKKSFWTSSEKHANTFSWYSSVPYRCFSSEL